MEENTSIEQKSFKEKIIHFFKDNFIFILTIIFCLIFITNFKIASVSGNSMDNTLADGERHLVKITDNINRNDIVVARNDLLDCVIIKRVIAIPGDTIEIKNNVIFLNGNILDEPYIKEDMITGDIASYTLKENEYFLCGDNRNNSTDSRVLGPIHNDDIIGKLLDKGDKNE